MRKFFIRLFIFISHVITVILLLLIVRMYLAQNVDWKIPRDKTIAFMGASQVSRDVDMNSILCGYNFSKPSERYIFTYLKLKKIVENNSNIKTIIMECAPTDLWQNSDDKYFVDNEMSEFVPLFYPYFDEEIIKDYEGHYLDMTKFIIQHLFDFRDYYGTKNLMRMGYGHQRDLLLEGTINFASLKPVPEQGEYGNAVNWKYLHKIIDYCKAHELKLYLVYFPMYHPEYYYDQEYYYKRINKLGDVNYLDYSYYPIPDSCRYDAHHLNKNGAILFTKQLVKDLNLN